MTVSLLEIFAAVTLKIITRADVGEKVIGAKSKGTGCAETCCSVATMRAVIFCSIVAFG